MNETLGRLSNQITTFFEKYDKKQKLKMAGVAVLVIAALAALILVINQPRMVMLANNLTPKQTADMRDVLADNNISHKVSSDGTQIDVESKQIAEAKMVLGQQGIPAVGFSYEDAFTSSFSTTESEKQKKFQLAFQQDLANSIQTMDGISAAIVNLVMPNQDRTIFDENRASKASAILTTEYDLSSGQVQGIVNFLAASVPNLEANNVKIIDHRGKILYLGEDNDFNSNISSQYEYTSQRSTQMRRDVLSALLNTGMYDDAEVVINLVVDFDKSASIAEEYSTPEGQTRGIPSSSYYYESIGSNNVAGGVPGLDANVDEFMMQDGNGAESSTIIEQNDYNVNKITTTSEKSIGNVVYDNSSIAVVVNRYRIYDEAALERQGMLDEMSFDEFRDQNMNQTIIPVEPEVIEVVRKATGINDVQVIGYEIPIFQQKIPAPSRPWTDYVVIGLIVLIIGLLAYVVYKGTEPVEVTEIAPELSVEDLLATTKEHQHLDEIEFDDKSETRKQIEKFVEEKPDAVAQLLRNWLNEDWE
jgi:flagellar M-ring protein FliF